MWWSLLFNKWTLIALAFAACLAIIGVQYLELGHKNNQLAAAQLQLTSKQNVIDSLTMQVNQCNTMVANQKALQATESAIKKHATDVKKKIDKIVIPKKGEVTNGASNSKTNIPLPASKGDDPVSIANGIIDDFNNRVSGK